MAIIGDVSPTSRRAHARAISLSRLTAYMVFTAATGFTAAVILGFI
jgi:hypothetical protein